MNVIIFTNIQGVFFQRSIGAYQVAHFLRNHGYTVQVIDFTDHFTKDELVGAVEKFITADTLAVGVSTTFYKNDDASEFMPSDNDYSSFPENVLDTLTYIKNNHSQVKIVVGGSRTELLVDNPMVDKIIQGYAEDSILAYIDSLAGRTEPRKPFDIEQLDHKFIENDLVLPNETLPIEISRGCIFKCTFCAYPLNGKSKMDYLRDAGKIKEEMISNYEKFGTTNYFFGDDTFNDSTYKMELLHKIFTDLPFQIRFAAYIRMDLLYAHKTQIKLLEEMGLASPFFGIETLNKRSGSAIGKGMNSDRAKEFLVQLDEEYWARRIPIICSFIVGLPYETQETLENTFQWIKSTRLNSIFFPLVINDKKYFKSQFDLKYSDYGYQYDRQTGYWANEHFNYNQASEIAARYNDELSKKENYPTAWFMMALLNHGYSHEELLTTPIKDLSKTRIFRARLKNIKEYKRKLMQL